MSKATMLGARDRFGSLRGIILAACAVAGLMATAAPASAQTVTYFTSRAAFEAALSSSTTIDFEGQAPESDYLLGSSFTLSGVTFSTTPLGGLDDDLVIADQSAPILGSPYVSDILFTNYPDGNPLTIALPGGVSAAGGWFGGLTTDSDGVIHIYGSSGLLASTQINMIPLSEGNSESFFGVIVTGDTLVSMHAFNNAEQVALDNFTYGSVVAIPEPSSYAMMLAGLALMGGLARRRKM